MRPLGSSIVSSRRASERIVSLPNLRIHQALLGIVDVVSRIQGKDELSTSILKLAAEVSLCEHQWILSSFVGLWLAD